MSEDRKEAMKSPKVSVVMPLYNTQPTSLKEAISSILTQTFTDFEYLILNDSPENTKLDEIVASYKDPRIVYLKNEKNIGLEASTNKLIDMARGKYIAIFDHDDISLPERLEKEVKCLDKNPNVGVVSGQFRVFGTQDIITENPLDSKSIRAMLLTVSCVSHTTAMFRKSVLNDNNIRYEKEFFPAASYRIITRLALVTDVQNLPDMLLRYRMDGTNTSIQHAEQRIKARERVQTEYGEGLVKRAWQKKNYKFDSVKLLNTPPFADERRYYEATQGKERYFIKSEAKDLSNEYRMAKTMFEKNKEYFIEPIDHCEDEYNYLMTRWSDGISLEKYIEQNTLTERQRHNLVQDLYNISNLLYDAGIVHRDLTPRNFLVSSSHLKLIDLHFAVDYSNYQELAYIVDNIGSIGDMGEPYAAGMYKWDDAFSFVKIAEYILSDNATENHPVIKKMAKKIGERAIVPKGELLRDVVIEQRQAILELREEIARRDAIEQKVREANQKLQESKSYKIGRKITFPFRVAKTIVGRLRR